MIRAIVTDIEGTTSSLSFVKDVLFPYARKHIASFLHAHAHEPAVMAQIAAVSTAVGSELTLQQVIQQLQQWIDEDRKITPLKALQGMIWEEGYRQGDFTGHIYEDTVRRLRTWQAAGVALYVFSSGSVQAQKLLFAHTAYGDLTGLFAGYFDTTIGNKRAAEAYRAINSAIGLPSAEILFLSDIVEELDAARDAGMHTCQLIRDGEQATLSRHRTAADFGAISLTT